MAEATRHSTEIRVEQAVRKVLERRASVNITERLADSLRESVGDSSAPAAKKAGRGTLSALPRRARTACLFNCCCELPKIERTSSTQGVESPLLHCAPRNAILTIPRYQNLEKTREKKPFAF